MPSTVSNLFLEDTTKIGLYLVTVFGKGIKFHLSFSISASWHLELVGTKFRCNFFDKNSHDQPKGNGIK
jgi:hypothetical protein